jgi:hypothetical protein
VPLSIWTGTPQTGGHEASRRVVSGDAATIGQAADKAAPGNVILLERGIYQEEVDADVDAMGVPTS